MLVGRLFCRWSRQILLAAFISGSGFAPRTKTSANSTCAAIGKCQVREWSWNCSLVVDSVARLHQAFAMSA